MIELRELTFLRGKRPIFEKLDFTFSPQAFTLLTGASGSGKSTLLQLIAGFSEMEYAGEIVANGKERRKTSIQERAQTVGMIFQDPAKQFTMSTLRREITFALENIGCPPQEIRQRITRALEDGRTVELADRLLNSLSGGEQQRAALSVVLALDAPILLLDEPFASIDRASRIALIKLLADLKKQGKTIIVSDHDISDYQPWIDRWVELKDGRLAEKDPRTLPEPEEMLELCRVSKTPSNFFELDDLCCRRNRAELFTITQKLQRGITTLTGDNGTGKSTLLLAMAQCLPYRGKMFFHKQRIKKRPKLYEQLSLVFQAAEKQFVTLTPREELAYGTAPDAKTQEKITEALEVLHLNAVLENSLFHLSEGQKKMIQLISMLSLPREFLLLDEPFSGLDAHAARFFAEWIKEKSREEDFLIVTHRLAPLQGISTDHLELKNRRLVRCGAEGGESDE